MKVTYKWLKQYVDFDWTPEELAERLTMLGLEVESMEQLGGGFDGMADAVFAWSGFTNVLYLF